MEDDVAIGGKHAPFVALAAVIPRINTITINEQCDFGVEPLKPTFV